jgi:hypothetical protein
MAYGSIATVQTTLVLLSSLLALLAPQPGFLSPQVPEDDTYLIRLRSREFTPTPGLDIAGIRASYCGKPEGRVHFLLQFESLPNAERQDELAAQDIRLPAYVTGNAYIASSAVGDLDNLGSIAGVRWAGPLEVEDKIHPDLANSVVPVWAWAGEGRVALTVQFHQDVDIAAGEALVTELGGAIVASVPIIPSITATFGIDDVRRIARQDIVQYVAPVEPPLVETNEGPSPERGPLVR